MTKRALITGITGMVGSHLLDYLLGRQTGKSTACFAGGALSTTSQAILMTSTSAAGSNSTMPICGTQWRYRIVFRPARPDYVFHLAAQSYPQNSFTAPLDTLDTNIQGTERLLGALRRFSPEAIIHVCASSEVFGRVPREKLPINEECTFHPASPYAISKVGTDLVGPILCRSLQDVRHDNAHVHPHRSAPRRRFRRIHFRQANRNDRSNKLPPVVKVGNLNSLRTWADVRDAVRAYHIWSRSSQRRARITTSADSIPALSARCWIR